MNNNAGAMSVGEIIENNCFRIPMYQRAYKWEDKQCKKIIDDLIIAYNNKSKKSLGLITLFKNKENYFDVIDGQQRFITLSIIGSLLGTSELIEKIQFERDEKDERKKAIMFFENAGFTDGDRIIRNANVISKQLENVEDRDEFWGYIKTDCLMLCGTVSESAIDEFMNLNAYKTPFSICDHIRSNLITLNTFHKEELQKNESLLAPALGEHSYKTAVAKLYDEVIGILYSNKNCDKGAYKSVYDVVSKNCRKVNEYKESRINIIFSEILNIILDKMKKEEKDNQRGYRCNELNQEFDGWLKHLIWIAYTKNLLLQLQKEMKEGNFSSAKLIDDYCNETMKPSFFSLITKDIRINEQTSNDLARILDKKSTIDNVIFGSFKDDDIKKPNLFLEALCSSQYNQATGKSYYNNTNFLNLKLKENIVNDCIQSAGKYIISRFLDEQQRSKDSYFQIAPILDFEDKENPKFIQCENANDEWTVDELFKENIFIPVIQRDYCMGSSSLQQSLDDNSNEDFLGFIINSFKHKKAALASTIIIAIDENNNRYIFDGQQRTYTIYQILKCFEADGIKNYKFIGRDEVSLNVTEPKTYIEESVINLQTAIGNRCKDIDRKEFVEFIKKSIRFKVKVVSEVSVAEQFFMDINGGVPLENYEIFKSCLINNIPEAKKESIVKKIENKWLKFFYSFKNQIYKDTSLVPPNHSEEELMEMRFIEYICRWVYKKDKAEDKLPDSFDIISSKSDLVHTTSYLSEIDFENVENIMEAITSKVTNCNDGHSSNVVKCCKKEFMINSFGSKTIVGYAYLDDGFKEISSAENFFIKRVIRSCSNIGRKSYFTMGNEEAIKYYDSDLIMDTILNQIIGISFQNELKKYKNEKLESPIHILAGYNNWLDGTITKYYEKLTELELPIYYVDDFFDNNSISSYCNLYKTYSSVNENNYADKVNETKDAIFLFIVQPPSKPEKLKLDTGATFINEFKVVESYSDGIDFKLKGINGQEYQLFLNRRSAYSIRLNASEKTILDKSQLHTTP